tara:strand:+ start:157 stop:693 length:537 start_codon:yes stop_codon:yes gene_type:complete
MKLIGKRIERLNQFGDNLVIKVADEGNMRLSPALMSRLKLDSSDNRVGFGYPENENESLVIYNASGNGVAVNKQGYIKNIPHNRDLRSYLKLPGTGDIEIYVAEADITLDEYPGMTFYKVSNTAETVEEITDKWEEEEVSNEQRAQNTIDDLHQAVEKSEGEVITKTTEDSLDVFGTN